MEAAFTLIGGGLLMAATLVGLFLLLAKNAQDRRSLERQVDTDRHDINNLLVPFFTMAGLLRLKSSGEDREVFDQLDVVRVAWMWRGKTRLDKALALGTDRLECAADCPGCHMVNARAIHLVTNLAVNAREAAARAGGTVEATCDHRRFSIVNRVPGTTTATATSDRPHEGLDSAARWAADLGWSVQSSEAEDEKVWVASVDMERAPTRPG